MGNTDANPPNEFKGYSSKKAKDRFLLITVLVGGGYVFIQMVVPFVMMLVFMPGMFSGTFVDFSVLGIDKTAVWNDRLWYIEETMDMAFGPGMPHDGPIPVTGHLKSIVPGEAAPPVDDDMSVNLPGAWLLPDRERLWIISSSGVAYCSEGKLVRTDAAVLGDIGRPFMYQNAPAVLERMQEGHVVKQLIDGDWQEAVWLDLSSDRADGWQYYDVLIVNSGPDIHVFAEMEGRVYSCSGLPELAELAEKKPWLPVGPAGQGWSAIDVNGRLVFMYLQRDNNGSTVVGLVRENDAWEGYFTHPLGFAERIGACGIPGKDQFLLLTSMMPWSAKVRVFENGSQTAASRIGRGGLMPFGDSFKYVTIVPNLSAFAILLAVVYILGALMTKHRLQEYACGDRSVRYAGLWPRGLAKLVDYLIMAAPLLVGGIYIWNGMFNADEFAPKKFMLMALFMMLGVFWMFVVFIVFSLMEGVSGRTPGKYLLGIKVVNLKLEPCGIGHGFLRNLLLLVDAMFNGAVGIMLVALTEKWQRLGDLAARTIVVDVNSLYESGD
ncbi:MAG: RDD family protein [Planctomycetes bacterium]|nr:RDD family protein [Planctomycetota bacterium]